MRILSRQAVSTLATVIAFASLSACGGGGGGGGGVASAPTPTPTPPPSPGSSAITLIKQVGSDITFSGAGTRGANGSITTAGELLEIRYLAATKSYEVRFPGGSFRRLLDDPTSIGIDGIEFSFIVEGVANSGLLAGGTFDGYQFVNIVDWATHDQYGSLAFGIPTPAGAVPTTGTATYAGMLWGQTTESRVFDDGLLTFAALRGTIDLTVDFAAGKLSGSIAPVVHLETIRSVGSFAVGPGGFTPGATSFSGSIAMGTAGSGTIAGRFAGPAAQELIGSLAFPYFSPADAQRYDAVGAFIARKPGQ